MSDCIHDFVSGAWSRPKCLHCFMRKEDYDRIAELQAERADSFPMRKFTKMENKIAELEDNAVADEANIQVMALKNIELQATIEEAKNRCNTLINEDARHADNIIWIKEALNSGVDDEQAT